jgi:DNA-binding Lrp family transcriptional regulator
MNPNNPYKEAHLLVAAVRVLEYRGQSPPTLDETADLLSISIEEAGRLCRKLESAGIIETVKKSDEIRLFVGDHRLIEQIPDRAEENPLSAELEKFQKQKQAERKTLDYLRSRQEEKRKKMHAQIQRQLKRREPGETDNS